MVKGDLKEVTSEAKEMESEVKEMESEVKEMANEIRYLARLQAALEPHDKAMAEKFFQDCVTEKLEFAEWSMIRKLMMAGTCAFCLA